MTVRLFTFICEIGGGTYCAQAYGADVESAVREWTARIRRERWVERLSEQVADQVIQDWDERDLPPVKLDGLSGVWCMSGLVDEIQFFVNIVESAWAPNAGTLN